jgi:L-fuconolactonase
MSSIIVSNPESQGEVCMIVDSHCHASPRWFEPVETLLFQMDRVGVARAVLTQLLGQFDNSYQTACVVAHPDRLASVGAVQTPDDVRRLTDSGAVGVRIGAAVVDDTLWAAVARSGLAVSVSGTAVAINATGFTARIAAMPEVDFVLEHLGGIGRPDFDGSEPTRAAVFALARFPNVTLKVPGLGQMGKRTSLSNDPPVDAEAADSLLAAVTHFGADRLMWGSDFPPVAAREGYANALSWPQQVLGELAEGERAAIFGGTAARVFKL